MTRDYKKQMIEAFNQADAYDQSAKIQKVVAQRLAARIEKLYQTQSRPVSILEIGCGTGLLTHYLVRFFPQACFVITDIAPNMVMRAQQKFKDSVGNISFKVMDGEYPELEQEFDLICSSLAFQWFSDMPKALEQLSRHLTPNGHLLCSTLAEGSFAEWQAVYQHYQYPCSFADYPPLASLNSYSPYQGHGSWQQEAIIDSTASGLEFIKGLHAIGAKVSVNTDTPLDHSHLRKVITRFDKDYGYTTYQVAFGHLQRFAGLGFFVTGTDTDVGKTFVSACLVKALEANYWKPIQTGLSSDEGDTKTVQTLACLLDQQIIQPLITLQAPLSPEDAAAQEGKVIDIHSLEYPVMNPTMTYIVEGAGGALVPIALNQFMTDLIQKINLPVIIVARTTLGTLNHTLMTIEALRNKNIAIAGVVLNGKPDEANKNAIIRHGRVKIIAEIPHIDVVSSDVVEQYAQNIVLPILR